MRFDRGLRSLGIKPYPQGYLATPTDNINKEAPHFQLGNIKDEGIWLTHKDMPGIIQLQVQIIPVWIMNDAAQAKLDNNALCSLYPPQSTLSCVRLEATGHGFYQKYSGEEKIPFFGNRILEFNLDLPSPVLYQKIFLVQPQGHVIQELSGKTSLWAYGGAQIGEDFHPMVCSLSSLQENTLVQPSSLLFWREKGIAPNEKQIEGQSEIFFQDSFTEDQTRTFLESLESGMSEIKLEIGINEKGRPLTTSYFSFNLSGNNVFYKRKE